MANDKNAAKPDIDIRITNQIVTALEQGVKPRNAVQEAPPRRMCS
jgi:hypothetical protein